MKAQKADQALHEARFFDPLEKELPVVEVGLKEHHHSLTRRGEELIEPRLAQRIRGHSEPDLVEGSLCNLVGTGENRRDDKTLVANSAAVPKAMQLEALAEDVFVVGVHE